MRQPHALILDYSCSISDLYNLFTDFLANQIVPPRSALFDTEFNIARNCGRTGSVELFICDSNATISDTCKLKILSHAYAAGESLMWAAILVGLLVIVTISWRFCPADFLFLTCAAVLHNLDSQRRELRATPPTHVAL